MTEKEHYEKMAILFSKFAERLGRKKFLSSDNCKYIAKRLWEFAEQCDNLS